MAPPELSMKLIPPRSTTTAGPPAQELFELRLQLTNSGRVVLSPQGDEEVTRGRVGKLEARARAL
jgi:hypothetical protein